MDKGEIFVYSLLGKDQFECLVSDGKHFKPGSEIVIDEKVSFLSLAFTENGIAFQIKGMDLLDFLIEILLVCKAKEKKHKKLQEKTSTN